MKDYSQFKTEHRIEMMSDEQKEKLRKEHEESNRAWMMAAGIIAFFIILKILFL